MPTALKKVAVEIKKPVVPNPIKARQITPRETEVLRLAALGFKNKEIAEQLGVRPKTVETHRANIMNKLAFRNVAQLVRYAIEKGITPIDAE